MVCPVCRGVAKRQVAHIALTPERRGVTVVHLADCATCGGGRWMADTSPPV